MTVSSLHPDTPDRRIIVGRCIPPLLILVLLTSVAPAQHSGVTLQMVALSPPDNTPSDVAMVRVEEFLHTWSHPVLPYIFFDEGSAAIPSRYDRYDRDQTPYFRENRLPPRDRLAIYRMVLNIIGSRMHARPAARITITGCISDKGGEQGDTGLSRQRAEAVCSYLSEIWDIDPARMTLVARTLPEHVSWRDDQDCDEENRRVEITSNDSTILAPVVITEVRKLVTPPLIRFTVGFDHGSSYAEWELRAMQERTELFYGFGTLAGSSATWDTSTDPVPKTDVPITVRATARRSDGSMAASDEHAFTVKQVTLQVKAADTTIRDYQYFNYRLILFDYNSSTLTPDHRTTLQYLKDRISELERVEDISITGHTDRVGADDVNLALSERRAAAVAAALGVPGTRAHGEGERRMLYDNSTPEGRMYSRTVDITVRLPFRQDH